MDRYQKKRVLIVDDSMISRRFMRLYLEKMGIREIVDVYSAKKGLKKLQEEKFDLVLSDNMMPGMSGLTLLREARKDENLKDIPFLMVTAEGLKGSIAEAFECGASGYVIKPYTFEAFSKAIKKILDREEIT